MNQKKMHMSGKHSSIGGERSETAVRGGRHVEVVMLDEFTEPRSNYGIFYAMWLAAQHIEAE